MHETNEHEAEFVGSKRVKFRGIAQVSLDSISFSDTSITQALIIDKNNVHQLKKYLSLRRILRKMNSAKAYHFDLMRKNEKIPMRVLEKRKKMIRRVIKQSA